jgi:RHS repeat-associated protein
MSRTSRNLILLLAVVLGLSGRMFASPTPIGTITITGVEQQSSAGAWDTGTTTVTINGISASVVYGQYSTSASIASGLAATISKNCNFPVFAKSSGAVISFYAKGTDAITSATLSSTSNNPSAFPTTSFKIDGSSGGSGISIPAISISPSSGAPGTYLTITAEPGTSFGDSQGSSSVSLGGIILSQYSWSGVSIYYWSTDTIGVTVPSVLPNGTYPVIVTVNGMASFAAPFTIVNQSSDPKANICAAGGVDYQVDNGDDGTDVEQTVCLYYDSESGIDATVETDNDSYATWQDPGTLWIFGIGAEAQVYGASNSNTDGISLISDTGMVLDNPSDTGGNSVSVQSNPPGGYAVYALQSLYSECEYDPGEFDAYGCTWDGPFSGFWVQLQVAPAGPIPTPVLSLVTSGTPSGYGRSVVFTVNISNGPNAGQLQFYDGNAWLGTGWFNGTTATFTTSGLALGSHSIFAVWAGNPNFNAATSNTVAQTIRPVIYDTGSVTLTVGPTSATTNFGASSTLSSVAQGLADAFRQQQSSPVSVSVSSGSWLTIAAKQGGDGSNYAYSFAVNYDSQDFASPSYFASSDSGNLSGGVSGVALPIYEYNAAGGYDANGNVLSYTDSVMGAWSFGYDQLNRLVTAANGGALLPNTAAVPAPGWAADFCWAYDAFGNRLAQSTSNTQFNTSDGTCSTSGTLYQNTIASYDAQNHVTSTNAPGFTLTPPPPIYDAAGDVVNDGKNAYLYDAEGRICAVASNGNMTGYLYDAAGNRVAKGNISSMSCDFSQPGSFQQTAGYVVGPSGEQLTEVDGNNNWKHTNVYAGGKQIGTYDAAGLHFYFDDPLGTRRAQTNAAGLVEATYQSLPFGDGLNQNPVTTADDPTENHFTGKERDTESGNDYFLARYYNSAMGRFVSPDWDVSKDPVPYSTLGNPQSLNLYAYVGDNPLSRNDPTGHAGCTAEGMTADCGVLSKMEQAGAAHVAPERGLSICGASCMKKTSVSVKATMFYPTGYGLVIELLAKVKGSNYVNFNWVQTVTTNVPLTKGEPKNTPYLDMMDSRSAPFYYNETAQAYWNARAQYEGGSTIFHDNSGRNYSPTESVSWHADLSLVGINRDGTYDTLKSYSYGFLLDDNKEMVQKLSETK